MITLTKDNFSQALEGNSLVFFHRLKGCPNCDKMLPQFESFEKEGVTVYEIDADAEKELTGQYAPNGNWNLPLTVYFENGKVVNTKTGIISILDTTKTLDNISNEELMGIKLNLDVELAQIRKQLYDKELYYFGAITTAIERRKNPTENTPTPAPEPDFLPNVPPAPHEEGCTSCQ